MGQGFISKYILRDIADFIRKRKGTTAEIKPVDMKAELESIPTYEQGKQAEHDLLWGNLQQNGKRAHYNSAFAYTGWNDEIYDPIFPITPLNSNGIGNIFFWNQRITDTKVPITATGNCSNAFANTKIIRIPKLIFEGATNINSMFLNCPELEELICEGIIDITGIDLHWSTKLSKASIISIINCLSITTSGLSITLSKEAVDNAFTAEEWTALEQTRPNWTISLV